MERGHSKQLAAMLTMESAYYYSCFNDPVFMSQFDIEVSYRREVRNISAKTRHGWLYICGLELVKTAVNQRRTHLHGHACSPPAPAWHCQAHRCMIGIVSGNERPK